MSSFLLQHFTSNQGDLYEGTMSDFRQEWMNTFENKTKSTDKEQTRIKAVTTALTLPDDQFMGKIPNWWIWKLFVHTGLWRFC